MLRPRRVIRTELVWIGKRPHDRAAVKHCALGGQPCASVWTGDPHCHTGPNPCLGQSRGQRVHGSRMVTPRGRVP